MNRNVLAEMLRLIDAGRVFAVATVAVAKGSVPAKAGSTMIVLPDGSQVGTVGGAGLEEKVKARALECLSTGRGGIFPFDLLHSRPGGLDSLCGGSVQIMIEPVGRRPHLLICGGGHVGLAVARAAVPLDYGYSVLDDRAAYCSRERFPEAAGLHHARPEEFFSTADLSPYTHLLILGYSHKNDSVVLLEAVRRFGGFIGLICSKTKRVEMFARLREHGISEEQLARVEAPVGLPIGGESPAEIAVSILGSVIRHVKGGAAPVAEVLDAEKAGSSGA